MNEPRKLLSLDDICTLIAVTDERGEYGEKQDGRTRTEVYCKRLKINQSEFYKAQQEGLRSDLCLAVLWDEYSGESVVEYDGREYKVYRVYERGDDYAELYLSERAGVGHDGE